MLSLIASAAVLPWLQGFQPMGVADHGSQAVVAELDDWRPAGSDDRCVAPAYGGLQLVADVSPVPGDERVIASFEQGIVVLDHGGSAIARAPGFTCTGSADELVALAAGDAWIGQPVLALAAVAGGHAETATSLTLYRVGTEGDLVPIFTGEVEHRLRERTESGAVWLFPGGLLYRSPGGDPQLWRYDPEAGRYVDHGSFARPAV
jgi:hypothetical protein